MGGMDELHRRIQRATQERQAHLAATLTLGEAVAHLRAIETEPIACACIGPPYCCRYYLAACTALQRGAHIAVKMMAGGG